MRKWADEKGLDYWRIPHADCRHESLWWYKEDEFGVPSSASGRVIDTYFAARARGLKVKPGEKDRLTRYLNELAHPHKVTVRRSKYWTLDAFALAHGLKRQWFYKLFRRLEETAENLFPSEVPAHRKEGIRNADLRERRAAGAERRRLMNEFEQQMAESPAKEKSF
jgi:hypothetical protein